MGCFFACFRMKDENQRTNQMVSKSISSKNRDPLVSRHQLGSVFLAEENGSSCERVERSNLRDNFQKEDLIDNELKSEAKFLKSCGALLETPGEIRKASQRTVSHSPPHEENSSSNFHSWLPGTSLNKLLWDEPLDHHSSSPKKHVYEDSQSPGKVYGRSVNFEDKKQMSGSASPSHPESQAKQLGPKSLSSPYPTPLKLNDEMQTPGTVYPTKLENFGTGKNVRIRTQYLYPVLNPVENTSQWQVLRGGSHQQIQSSEIIEQQRGSPDTGENKQQLNKMYTPTPKDSKSSLSPGITSPNAKGDQNSERSYVDKFVSCNSPSSVIPLLDNREKVFLGPNDEQLVVSSLSQWLKPLPENGGRGKDHDTINENSHSEKSPSGDRPILGTVAAHWNDDEPSNISPKWWDGNGIPNSTNKYKEDQKVKWHATPFEERLEKALSEEKLFPPSTVEDQPEELFPPRKNLEAKIMEFDYEGEESDTAAS